MLIFVFFIIFLQNIYAIDNDENKDVLFRIKDIITSLHFLQKAPTHLPSCQPNNNNNGLNDFKLISINDGIDRASLINEIEQIENQRVAFFTTKIAKRL